MPIVKGTMTVRRYFVDGESPSRDKMIDALNANAFREPISVLKKEETIGWCQEQNLLDVDFSDINTWLLVNYAIFSIRVDKKSLPSNLFKAHLEKRKQKWCAENGRERVPAKVKEELKELLEVEMLKQTLPRVTTCGVVWNVQDRYVLVHSQSDALNDKVRNLFYRTFGISLIPVTPGDWVTPATAERLSGAASSVVGDSNE